MNRLILIAAIVLIAACAAGLVKAEPSGRTHIRLGQQPAPEQREQYQRKLERERDHYQRQQSDFRACLNAERSDPSGNPAFCFEGRR